MSETPDIEVMNEAEAAAELEGLVERVVQVKLGGALQDLIAHLIAQAQAASSEPEPAPEPEPYVRQGDEFEPGARVKLKGKHRDPAREVVGYEQKIVGYEKVTVAGPATITIDDRDRPTFDADGNKTGYEQITVAGPGVKEVDDLNRPVYGDDKDRPITKPVEASEHGMIATDAPPQQGTVIAHEPAVWPHTERRHRIELDFGQGFMTCDFVDLEALDG